MSKSDWQQAVASQYQVLVTREMQTQASQSDAVARQFYPDPAELDIKDYEQIDPIGDKVHAISPHLIHRYESRVLWKIVPICAVYCRFCFRKALIGNHAISIRQEDIEADLKYIQNTSSVDEVILSGGDPLALSVNRLRRFLAPLKLFKHVRRIRIHTRVPIVSPKFISDALLDFLGSLSKEIVFVIHTNHADEFHAEAEAAIEKLTARFLVLSQSVLLKGVNDDPFVLKTLMNKLLSHKIKPYYLHHLDAAKGTDHFRVSLAEGSQIYRQLRQMVSGIALPAYIVEIPNGKGKVPVLELTSEEIKVLSAFGIR